MKAQLRINGLSHQQIASVAKLSGLTFTAKPVTMNSESFETIVGVAVYHQGGKVGCFRHMGQGKGITLEVNPALLPSDILASLIANASAFH